MHFPSTKHLLIRAEPGLRPTVSDSPCPLPPHSRGSSSSPRATNSRSWRCLCCLMTQLPSACWEETTTGDADPEGRWGQRGTDDR